jgi:alanyl-tRNA synthetase
MTEKIYVGNPYQKTFNAKIMDIKGDAIILDKTCFFPEGGGQIGDKGYLGDLRVIETKYSSNRKDICHIVEGDIFYKKGDSVKGIIDWDRRYKIMKLHSASHIMEYFLFELFPKLKLVGSHVNEKHDSSTYLGDISPEKIEELNELINNFIAKDYEIKRWEDSIKKGWMHWEAGEIKIPCGGTHPLRTSEIGMIKVKVKGGGKGKKKVLTSLLGE